MSTARPASGHRPPPSAPKTRWHRRASCVAALALLIQSAPGAVPVMRVVKGSGAASLLVNGDFERARDTLPAGWQPAPQGCSLAPGEGRAGSQALRAENSDGKSWTGASQTITLNRTEPAPLIVHGWSRAEGVGGAADTDYALYVDLIYADGTPLWGQTASFHAGTHDWEARQLIIVPAKPIRSVTLHCLFRHHPGRVWFDDVTLEEIKPDAGALFYQGAPMAIATPPAGHGPETTHRTRDGLETTLRGGRIVSLRANGRDLAAPAASGFLARDVAAGSDLFAFEDGACAELGLKIEARYTDAEDHIAVEGQVIDTRGGDRAVTLVFALPVDTTGWRWDDDIRRGRAVTGTGEFANTVAVQCGATGTMSLYPLGAVHDDRTGLALAIDMGHPAQYRIACVPAAKQVLLAWDFGLSRDTAKFPGAAPFRFVFYQFEARHGFRGALEKLNRIFPAYFRARSRDQGLWMPFTKVNSVSGWEDFGFRYHEGDNDPAWDRAHGVLSFHYTEPMTWWMPMAKGTARTIPEALRQRAALAGDGKPRERQMAQICETAAMSDSTGEPGLMFRDTPWCDGAVWSLNPNPALPAGAGGLNAATVYWNDEVKRRHFGPGSPDRLDGEYLDSLEGYVTANLNFRREHFRSTSVPLTFDTDTGKPALFKGLAVFEFTRWFCEEVHALGKLTFANGVPYRFTCLCPWLDVLGTETDWLPGGKYHPAGDTEMSLWRSMAGAKPYLLLMNTDYDALTPDLVERYFQRSLFYGMWPGMFSHNAADNPYWGNPKWYNRDRPLFKKYLPVIKAVAEAGWHPETGAECDNPRIWVERFGPQSEGPVFLTLYNDTSEPQSGMLRLEGGRAFHARDRLTGEDLGTAQTLAVRLGPEHVRALEVTRE